MGEIRLIYNSTQSSRTISGINFIQDQSNDSILISDSTVTDVPANFITSSDKSGLINVVIGMGIISIGENAFINCTNLTDISIAETVFTISSGVFESCTSLTNVRLPIEVTILNNNLFKGCTSLLNIIYSDNVTTIVNSVFEGCTSLANFIIKKNITTIGNNVFKGCSMLTNLFIPDTVTNVGDGLLQNCTKLTNVYVGDSVTTLGSNFFLGDISLNIVILGNSITNISNNLFENCVSLSTIYIPLSIATIGNSSFKGCVSLTSLVIPLGVTTIGSSAFENCTALTTVVMSRNITSIGSSAFKGCTGILEMDILNGVTMISANLFENCSELKKVYISNNATEICNSSFKGCSKLQNITIPDSVTNIGSNAFQNSGLKSIRLSMYVSNIGSYAFSNCYSLTDATLLRTSSVSGYHSTAFNGSNIFTKVYINKADPLVTPADPMRTYFINNYSSVNIFVIPSFTNINIEIPITMRLETNVESYAEFMNSMEYDFLLEEQKVLDSNNSYKNYLISEDVLKANLKYLQIADVTNMYLANSESAREALLQAIDSCNVENRFMLTHNKVDIIGDRDISGNIKYPNATVSPKIFSLTEHWVSYLASVFFKNPETRAPIANILSIKNQIKNGLLNKTIGQQFIEQINPLNNPYTLRSIYEQMIAKDPIRFTNIDDSVTANEFEDSNGISMPFRENDTITFNLNMFGTIKTENSVYNNTYAVSNIKNIKDIFASLPWCQDYYETSSSENILTIIPKTFKIQCVVGPLLLALNDMPYIDSNKILNFDENSNDYIYTNETSFEFDPTVTSTSTTWNTVITDSNLEEKSMSKSVEYLTSVAVNSLSQTLEFKPFQNITDMLTSVTDFLSTFCMIFDILKNTTYNDMESYVNLMWANNGSSGNKKSIINIEFTMLRNLIKGIINDISMGVRIMVNVKAKSGIKIFKTIKIIASIVNRVCTAIKAILGWKPINVDLKQFVEDSTLLSLAAENLQNEMNNSIPSVADTAKAADRAKKYLIDQRKNDTDASGNLIPRTAGNFTKVKSGISEAQKFSKNLYGKIYEAVERIQMMSDIAVAIMNLEPSDINDLKNVKSSFFPDPIEVSKGVKNLINSSKELKGKKDFQLFMGALDLVCSANDVLLTILTPSQFDFMDFLKLIQFKKVEKFFTDVISGFSSRVIGPVIEIGGIVENGVLRLIDDVGDNVLEIKNISKVFIADAMDEIGNVEHIFTSSIKVGGDSFIDAGRSVVQALNDVENDIKDIVQSIENIFDMDGNIIGTQTVVRTNISLSSGALNSKRVKRLRGL
jgi:hypothetical protein